MDLHEWPLVVNKDTPDNIKCAVEYGPMEECEPSTGDNIFIPFDIIKNPSMVACSLICNISMGKGTFVSILIHVFPVY